MKAAMNASDPITPLRQLAAAAEEHAREEHGKTLGIDSVREADRILQAEAGRLTPERLDSLSACYGAWLGWLTLQHWDARWVGFYEPTPPRVLVAGQLFSPMNAVRRLLQDPNSERLAELLTRIENRVRDQDAIRARAAERNRAAWDALAADPRFAGGPFKTDRSDLDEWLRDLPLEGKALLCLGAGGGRQGPLHAAVGADVTVVDVSDKQLDHDRKAGLKTLCTSMDKLDGLRDASFDIVVQPVSSCYVADLDRVHAELARVLKPGGLYIVQHKQPGSLGAAAESPYAPLGLVALAESTAAHREPGTIEFVHSLDTLLGGLCRAGFAIEDVAEPPRGDLSAPPGSPGHRATLLPPYLKIKARRR
jgi:SAM-dependent methyltransferase